jgi:hypothetical protein
MNWKIYDWPIHRIANYSGPLFWQDNEVRMAGRIRVVQVCDREHGQIVTTILLGGGSVGSDARPSPRPILWDFTYLCWNLTDKDLLRRQRYEGIPIVPVETFLRRGFHIGGPLPESALL